MIYEDLTKLHSKIYFNHDYIVELMLKNGKEYIPAVRPADIIEGEVGDCFDSSLLNAFRSLGKYRYVEGIATSPITGQWIVHAWVTDGIHAFDPTWKMFDGFGRHKALNNRYLGLEMNRHRVYDFLKATEYKSILINGYRNYKLALEVYNL